MIRHVDRNRWIALWVALAMAVAPAAQASRIRVAIIVARHADGHALDADALRDIYLKKVFVDARGDAYVPVNLPPDRPLRKAFIDAITHMDRGQLEEYWNRKYFQGTSPPYVLGSQQAVVEFVGKTPGAVGYVQACHVTPEVRVVGHLLLDVPGLHGCREAQAAPP